jgi:hypothetical protein
MWNPSNKKLSNQEEDEAGRLAGFRARFGRGFDAAGTGEDGAPGKGMEGKDARGGKEGEKRLDGEGKEVEEELDEEDENLLDLITGFGQGETMPGSEKDVVRSRRRQG